MKFPSWTETVMFVSVSFKGLMTVLFAFHVPEKSEYDIVYLELLAISVVRQFQINDVVFGMLLMTKPFWTLVSVLPVKFTV